MADQGAQMTPMDTSALPGAFVMAVGEVDITPPAGAWMAGYGWGPRRNDGGVARPLRAHCARITDAFGNRIVLVRIDVVSISRDVYQDILSRLMSTGVVLAANEIIVAQSHTHSGPFIGFNPDPQVTIGISAAQAQAVAELTDRFVDQIVDLVTAVMLGPGEVVTLQYAEGGAFIARNRDALPYAPAEVPILLARRGSDGVPYAVLFGHACHPVCRGRDSTIDSDHCGYAAELVTQRLGVPALFFQGACGDLNPGSDSSGDGLVVDIGRQLADAVVAMVRNNAFLPVTGPFDRAFAEITLPFSVDTTDPDELAELRERYQQRIDTLGNGTDEFGAARRHAQRIVSLIDEGSVPSGLPMTLQRWRLGGLTIVAMSHEVVSGRHVYTKSRYPGPLWIMAYANYSQAYVPGDDLLWRGEYAAAWNAETGNRVTGIKTSGIPYLLPAPLRASPPNTSPASPDSAEGVLTAALDRLLTS
jgi:neutral ceramidase